MLDDGVVSDSVPRGEDYSCGRATAGARRPVAGGFAGGTWHEPGVWMEAAVANSTEK